MILSNEEMLSLIQQVTPADLAHFKPLKIDNFHANLHEDFMRIFQHTLSWLNQQSCLTKKHVIALFKRWNDLFVTDFFQISAIEAAYSDLMLAKNYTPCTQLNLDQDKLFSFLVTLIKPELTVRFLLRMQEANQLDQSFFDKMAFYFRVMTPEKSKFLTLAQEAVFILPDATTKKQQIASFKEQLIKLHHIEQVKEIKKNARTLATLQQSLFLNSFKCLPTETLIHIIVKTSDLNEAEAKQIALKQFEFFPKPSPR